MYVYWLYVLFNLVNKIIVNKNISKMIYKLFVGMIFVMCYGGYKNIVFFDDLFDVF